MKVLLVEVCRSPEYDKGDTEAVFLSRLSERWDVPYTLFSNDGGPEPGENSPVEEAGWPIPLLSYRRK